MSFSVNEKLPDGYFQEVMNTQRELIDMCLDNLDNALTFSSYCKNTMANFRFYFCNDDDASPLLQYTFWNLGDLQEQLYNFWIQLIHLLKGD